MDQPYFIESDAVLFGVLALILGLIFYTKQSKHPIWVKFYTYIPALLLCYLIPSFLTTFGLINVEDSQLYYMASRYLLPAALVLLTLSVDLKGIIRLGPKAGIMFLTGTLGIVIGGPVAFIVTRWLFPEAFAGSGGEDIWRGMTTLAGSWIGGGANQAAMMEVWEVSGPAFTQMVAIDVVWANIWMSILLLMAARSAKIDARTGADVSAIERIKLKMETFQKENERPVKLDDLMLIAAIAFGVTGLAHAVANWLGPAIGSTFPVLAEVNLDSTFFWLVIFATLGGVLLSFTKARNYEGAGASAVGSVFIYILVATIGLKMDVTQIKPFLFVIGGVWISIHAALLLLVGKLIKAPVFFLAVGSQANVGGAASAPVVASAFHVALAPVGVLLAVFGYVVGTSAAMLTGIILQYLAT
ncbi:DUF819 family protein [Marinicella gelatinilytica]|uniref:DUF819 family protein n=1 Tax=Marinicella gelatinilytica TaxID=2996017 RepID=UPI002260E20A|nr:DUF819 family protein [Marinicella gelatinilytica]MCX7544526.1 DUF819 family protein [Marinicella gelatinilytica]